MTAIYTIGHSNVTLDTLVGLLRSAEIDVVADVRTSPFSRYAPQFNEPSLRAAIRDAGLQYVPMGAQLGGRPSDPAMYDPDGHVNYARLARQSAFLQGIERLESGITTHRVAVLCSEESPIDCHRRLLIGRVLTARGVEVIHIRGDGRQQPDVEATAEEQSLHPDRSQLSMFSSEEESWRSIRSVSPSGPPRSSSEHWSAPESKD